MTSSGKSWLRKEIKGLSSLCWKSEVGFLPVKSATLSTEKQGFKCWLQCTSPKKKSIDCRLQCSGFHLICDKWSILQLPLQILLSIMKICIKVAPKILLLGRFHMLKDSGTLAKDCCKGQQQKHTPKNLRLLYARVSYFSAWKSRGADLGNFPYLGHNNASDYPLSHQTGHKSTRKLCKAPWEEGRLIVYLLYVSPVCTRKV